MVNDKWSLPIASERFAKPSGGERVTACADPVTQVVAAGESANEASECGMRFEAVPTGKCTLARRAGPGLVDTAARFAHVDSDRTAKPLREKRGARACVATWR